jgi:serine protease Do
MRETGFGEVADALRRSTVQVGGRGRGFGSGIILGADGLIITNAHVVPSSQARGQSHGQAQGLALVKLWDGRTLEAVVTARDPGRDLAALRVSEANLPAATLADSSKARVGELVFAVGNPLGFEGALSSGIIHAAGAVRGLGGNSWLQADVQLAPGNSGGPLADARGRVLGINTMVAGGLALAVPSNDVKWFIAQGAPDLPLGIVVRAVRVALRGANRIGMLITDIAPGGAASLASLMLGDILVGVEGALFRSVNDLHAALHGAGGRVLHLQFLRGERQNIRKVAVRLGVAGRVAA